ncbi:T1SS-143 repeat domain-containing protein [Devosia riboflavina]
MVERIGNEEGIEFGANVEAAEPILVAQADTGTAAQPAPTPTAVETRVVVELEDGYILRLPATASVDQPRENGTDLEFVQADGTVIVVPNGAIQGLTIFIGDAEIPPLTVAALFESNGIEAAAGPAGAGASARGSGGNFEVPVGGIGDAFALGDLLDPTALAFGTPGFEDLYPANTKPSFLLGNYSFRISEEGLAAGLADFGPAGGADTTNDSFYFINLGAMDPDGDSLTFTLSAPTEGLTSNGGLIVWEGVGTNHLIGRVGGATVIDITIGGKSGLLIVQLLEPIDHPTGNTEDVLDLGLTVTANDGRGGTATATITIGIEDDSPEIGVSQSTGVDEDGLKGGVGDSASPGDNSGNAVTATGSLGIKWGADNGDKLDTLNEDGSFAQDSSGRSVYFSQANFLAFVENYGSLTSGGLPLVFSWTGNTITASVVGEGDKSSQLIFKISLSDDASGSYKFQLFGPLDHEPNRGQQPGEGGSDLPPSEGEMQAKIAGEGDDDGDSYEDDIVLNFEFTAKDADGDTVGGNFAVTVDDDMPVLISNGERDNVRIVDEDDIRTALSQGTSPNDGAGDGSYTGNPATNGPGPAYIYGSLGGVVNFGADGPGGFAVNSGAIAKFDAYGLESHGDALMYSVKADATWATFTATAGEDGRTVFEFRVNVTTGDYEFRLYDQLDHDAPASGSDQNFDLQNGEGFEDVFSLDFGAIVRAYDGDGDYVDLVDQLLVKVRDDVPELVRGKSEIRTVDEDDIRTIGDGVLGGSTGTSPNDGNADGSYTGSPYNNGPGAATITGSLAHLVRSGSDESLSFGFASEHSVRSQLSALGLKSGGQTLSYDVQGNVLYGFVNANGIGQSYDVGEDRPVFKLTLNADGSYKFELIDQLDHDRGDGQNFDLQDSLANQDVSSINFGKVILATDNDGDSVSLNGAFQIKIRDDVPELIRGQSEIRTVDEDDIRTNSDGLPGGSTGTSPNANSEGQGDNSRTGSNGAAYVQGSLAHLVQSGADEGLTFGFVSENSVRSQLSALGLKSNGETLSYDVQGNVLYAFANKGGNIGQSYDVGDDRPVFKLTLNADGSYKFELIDQLDHDLGSGQNYGFQDSLPNQDVSSINFGKLILATDNDGDSVSLDGAFQIKIRDDVPELAKHGLVFGVVEEEQLSGGNEDTDALLDLDYDFGPWGQNYNVISTVASDNDLMSLKNLIVGGADENGKFSARAGITNSVVRDNDGNVVKSDGVNVVIKSVTSGTDAGGAFTLLTAAAGNNPVFTLKVYADGDWRFQLLDQLDHKADNLEDVLALDLAAFLKYTDFDGDSVNLDGESFLIKVIDDTPEASLKLKNGAKLILDETKADSPQDTSADGNADDEKGIANPFSQNYGQLIGYAAGGSGTLFMANPSVGADQNGRTVYSLSISGNNDSGVDDTATGKNILLFKEGNDIVGRVGGSNGAVAFVIRADANTGEVKVYQFRAVEHDNDGSTQADHDESSSPEYLDANKITLTQTVTDEDGDKDTASIDLGKVIGFEDDGPKITKLELGQHTIVSHDETPGVNGDADDIYGALSIFNSVTNRGDDLDVSGSGAIGFAKEDNLISYGTNFGADGKASSNDTVFSLVLKGGNGQDSGLKTTEGAAIKLYLEHGIIVGRVGDASGKAAFAIAVDSDDGDISLVQYLSIQHPTGGSSHDESVGLDLVDTNAIEVKLTIKDGDGDTDSKTVDISDSVRFQDDGPSIEVDRVKDHGHYAEPKSILLDETTPGGNPNDNTGNADWSLTTNPAAALAIGQVTSSASGNGSIASLFAIDVDGGADGIRSVVKAFTFDLRDDKGNLVTNNTTGVETTLKVTQVAGTALGGLDAGERTIWLYRLDDKTIIGKIFGDGEAFVALKIELTGTAENPQFTVTQYLPVDHPNSFDHDEGLSLKFDDKDASLSIKLTATVTDKDGDTATNSESVKIIDDKSSIVTIEDDGPTITGVTYATLGQELIQNGGFELGHGLNGANWDLFNSIPGWNAGTNVPFEVQSGGAGGVPNTNGAVVELDGDTQSNGTGAGNGTAVGATNASIQQVVSGTEAGQTYQLTFDVAPRSNGGVNTAGLEVYFGGTKVFPLNGQTVAADQWTTITLTVTAPTNNAVLEFRGTGVQDEYGALIDNVSVKAKSFGLDDESQAGGIVGGPGDDPSGKVLSGKINFDAGTDHLKAIVVDDNINVDAIWVDANGVGHRVDVDVKWIQDGQGGKLVGTMERGGETRPVFELVVNANGSFTLTMQAPLAHPYTDADGRNNGPETEWEDNLSLQFDYKVIDNDGDTASGSIKVSVDDDSPDFVGGIEDQTVQTLGQAVNGDLNINFGADGQYADKGLVISGYENLPGVNEQLSSDGRTLSGWVGNTKVYELKLNSNGTYDFTQFAKVPGAVETLSAVSFDANFSATSSKDYGEFVVKALGNGKINGSNSGPGGIGVGNDSGMDGGEKLEIVFDSQMTSVTLGINHSGHGDMDIDWIAYDQNGNVVASGSTSDFDGDTSRTINPGVGFYKLVLTADDDSGYRDDPSFRISSLSGVKASTGNIDSLDFTVTAKDGDKDAQSDSFTVTLKNNTAPTITVNTGNEGNANDVAHEEALSTGSNPTSNAETVTGTITVADADGLADIVSVTIDGAGAGSETQSLAALVGKTVQGAHGVLTITGVTNGVISYSYTLTSATTDIQNALETDVFSVSVSDGEESASSSITIEIADDGPKAVNDTGYNVVEDAASLVSGNVLANDTSGADAPKSFVNWSAADTAAITALNTYGTLTQNSDGSWSFALDNTRAATQALTAASNLSYTLNYTMKDADGDTASATLTINIKGANDSASVVTAQATGADNTVYESGLNPNGSDAAATTETATGSFAVTATDGISSVVIGGTSFTLAQLQAFNGTQTVSTGEGTLKLISYTGSATGGTVNYSYTLNATIDNDSHVGATPTGFDDSVTVTVNGVGGTTSSDTIVVTIVDDVPTAFNEAAQNVNEGATVAGNFDFVQGADGATLTHINGNSVGAFDGATGWSNWIDVGAGEIRVKASGAYEFKADNPTLGASIDVDGNFTVTDNDGDSSTKTFAFDVKDVNVPTGGTHTANVDDDGLVGANPAPVSGAAAFSGTLGGSVGGDTPGVFSFAALAGSSVTVGQESVDLTWAANVLTATGPRGVLFTVTVTNPATGAYTVDLKDNVLQADGNGDNTASVNLGYNITDADASQANGTLTINFNDDVPTANSGAALSILETAVETTGENLLLNDAQGADGATVTAVNFNDGAGWRSVEVGSATSITVTGVGTFKVNADGSWTLAPALNASTSDQSGSFTYRITDADGDSSTAAQAYTVKHTDTVPTAGTAYATVDDDGLPGGNAAGTGDATAGTPETVAEGTLPHNFLADGAASTDPISFASMTSGTVGTESVTYAWNATTNTLTATSARGAIFTVQVDNGSENGNGAFKVTLLKPIMHALGGDENDALVNLTYTVKDGNNDTATGTLQITFDDDTPVATAQSVTITEGTEAKSNVVLVLDRSTSMEEDGDPSAAFASRISLMKAAIGNLFASGNVNAVFIVSFAGNATFHNSGSNGGWYTDLNAALAAVNALTLANYTDYDAALATLQSNYTAPPTGGDQTVLMFLSDGEPTDNNGTGSDGIIESDTNGGSVGEETAWINFISTKGIDAAYAFGFGGLNNSSVGYLRAYRLDQGREGVHV